MARESWSDYVARITAGVPREDVAEAAGVNVSSLSRWVNDKVTPKAEKVVEFARALGQSPIEALIAAGYLEPEEAAGVIEVVRSLNDVSNDELLHEVGKRMSAWSRPQVDDITPRLSRPDDLS